MIFKIIFSVIILFLFANDLSYSQLLVSQNMRYLPKFDSNYNRGYLANSFFNTEALITNGSYQGDKDKIYRIIGGLEIYRNEESVLWMSLGNELDANSKNNISFNPRQSIWEEALNYSAKFKSSVVNIGLFYRCKHEIDNSDAPSGDTSSAGYIPIKRVLILNGLNLGFSKDNDLGGGFNLKTNYEIEYYFVPDDYRQKTAEAYVKPDWNQLTSVFKLNARLNYMLLQKVEPYLRLKGDLFMFTRNTTAYYKNNYGVELGLSILGIQSDFDFFLIHESIFDELAFLVPNSSKYTGIGIRLRGNNFF